MHTPKTEVHQPVVSATGNKLFIILLFVLRKTEKKREETLYSTESLEKFSQVHQSFWDSTSVWSNMTLAFTMLLLIYV